VKLRVLFVGRTRYRLPLPSWLELNSPSIEKTVQTGPSTLRTGFGAHAARARDFYLFLARWRATHDMIDFCVLLITC